MFEWIKSWFRPTIIEVTFEPEDPIQTGVDILAEGINYLLKHNYEHELLSELLRQMADDIKVLHTERTEDNVVYPVFDQT